MLTKGTGIALALMLCLSLARAQEVTITVDASRDKRAVSPYIYGLNNGYDKPAQFYRDAGVQLSRMNNGNNATKYNWRKKITSHPDWYNNVYTYDWDARSKVVSANHPDMQIMWAFQLLGRVASTNAHNFNEGAFNNYQLWEGVNQNLAGGGTPNTSGTNLHKAAVEGDMTLYTREWPADSTVAILDHWFGEGGLGLNQEQFHYWNMDNEPDIWNGTHDDVMSDGQLPAAEFMDRYIEVAKKAKALFPDIKICGPVTTSEWHWFKWGEESIRIDGRYYCWFEYFIKRCADEEKASGVRVVDVFDIHHYPWSTDVAGALQNHRSFFDRSYIYPGANGVKTIYGGWDTSQNKVYIFARVNDWLNKHFGANHGIGLGVSEWSVGVNNPNPNVASVIYASTLGTFANHGVEYFTPWHWNVGMWETLHLFSRYARAYSVSSTSTLETSVSAYTTLSEAADSMTVILVNRDLTASRNVTVNLAHFTAAEGNHPTLQLSSLPAVETFKTHTNNALKKQEVAVASNTFTLTLPALSTTAVLLKASTVGSRRINQPMGDMKLYPNPAGETVSVQLDLPSATPVSIILTDQQGRRHRVIDAWFDGHTAIRVDVSTLPPGFYLLSATSDRFTSVKRLVVKR